MAERRTLASLLWIPQANGYGDRAAPSGLYINSVEVWREGQPVPMRDPAALIASRAFGSADYVDPAHHSRDHWAWCATVAGLERATATQCIAAYGLLAALPPVAGLALAGRAWPQDARLRRPRKARRVAMR